MVYRRVDNRGKFLERAMGIEQIRMNQTKALPPVPQFNWSQMESTTLNRTIPCADAARPNPSGQSNLSENRMRRHRNSRPQ